MAFCGKCGKNKKNDFKLERELMVLKELTRFTENEIKDIRNRFITIAQGFNITKVNFRENMGILGLETSFFLSDRIFEMLDKNKDGKVDFKEFLVYMDVMINGENEEKAELSYRIIDSSNKGYFDLSDFSSLIRSIITVWCSLTGSQLTQEMNKKIEYYIEHIFNQMDINGSNKVNLHAFKQAIEQEPNLLEIFDFLNKGVTENLKNFDADAERREKKIADGLNRIEKKLNILVNCLRSEDMNGRPVPTINTNLPMEGLLSSLSTPNNMIKSPAKPILVSNKLALYSNNPEEIPPNRLSKNSPFSMQGGGQHFFEIEPAHNGEGTHKNRNSEGFSVMHKYSLKGNEKQKQNRYQFLDRMTSHDEINLKASLVPVDGANLITHQSDSRDVSNNPSDLFTKPANGGETFEVKNRKLNYSPKEKQSNPNAISENGVDQFQFSSNQNFMPAKKKNSLKGKEKISIEGYMGNKVSRSHNTIFLDEEDFSMNVPIHQPHQRPPENIYPSPNTRGRCYMNPRMDQNNLPQHMLSQEDKGPGTRSESCVSEEQNEIFDIDIVEHDREEEEDTKFNGSIKKSEKDSGNKGARLGDHSIDFFQLQKEELKAYTEIKTKASRRQFLVDRLLELIDESKVLKDELEENQTKSKNKKKEIEESQMFMLKTTALNIPKTTKKDFINLNSVKKNKSGNSSFVFLGHNNWNMVLNMMIGIQMSVRSIVLRENYVLQSKDFKLKYYFELVPRRSNSSKKDNFKICKFHDYAPYVFNDIRNLYRVSNEQYLKSIGPENLLSSLLRGNLNTVTELCSSGKSGSFFYYSADGRFTLKTIHRQEFHFLRKILRSYYEHLFNNPQSMIIKFFGLHKLRFRMRKSLGEKKIYFVIMSNVFHTVKEIHARYDIKGSLYKRLTPDSKDPSIAKKDLNWLKNGVRVRLEHGTAENLKEIIEKDCKFFESNSIIDYSLLIGIHQKYPQTLPSNLSSKPDPKHKEEINVDEIIMKQDSLNDLKKLRNSFDMNEDSGVESSDHSEIYYLGIIDILTHFNTKKKIEYACKYTVIGKTISAIPPKPYSERFQKFILENVLEGPQGEKNMEDN